MAGEGPPLFFIHVMKTAGTTFFFHLRARYGYTWLFPGALQEERPLKSGGKLVYFDLESLLEMPMAQRMGFKAFAGHYPYSATEAMGFDVTRLTILRDPVDRTISYLRHARQYQPEFAEATAEEIYGDTKTNDHFIRNHQTKVFSMPIEGDVGSVLDIVDVGPAHLEVAKENLAKVDLLGLQSRFDEFLFAAEQRYGIVPQDDVAPQRVGVAELDITESLRDRIAEDNAIDLELYAHAERLYEARALGTAGPPATRPSVQRIHLGGPPRPPEREGPVMLHLHLARNLATQINRDLRKSFADEAQFPYPDGTDPSGRLVPRTDVAHLLSLPPELLAEICSISGHFPYVVAQLLAAPTVTIAVLRDPVERVVDQVRNRVARRVYEEDQTPEEVYEHEEYFEANLHDYQAKQFAWTPQDVPECHLDRLVVDDDRLAIAKANLAAVDVLGLSEDLEAVRRELAARFGIRRAKEKPLSDDLDAPPVSAALRRRIAEDNRGDLELYELARELVAERARG